MTPAADDSLVGATLAHYEILEKLGEGGMGVVYRALDTRLHREVALKVLPPCVDDEPEARERLIREARIASRLNHPHICTVHEVGEEGGRVFVAMELVAGRTLKSLIPPGGMAGETVARFGAQIARALAHAHEHGVVHRDLKSANVVVGAEGRTRLLDFGLSRRCLDATAIEEHTLTRAGLIAGTPQYLAPELLLGGSADARSDIWALGVILYEMGAGRVPFGAESMPGIVGAILHTTPDPLPERLSPGLRSVVMRCLTKEPEQRYAHAAEVGAALEALLPESIATTGGIEPRSRPRRARRLAVPLAAAALAVIAALAWWRFHGVGAAPAGTVLILPMEVRGQVGGAEFAGRAFSEALAVDLAQQKGVRVMPVPASGTLPAASTLGLARAAFLSGAGRLVTGALTRDGDSLRASVSLIDAQANQVLWGEQRAVSGGDLAPLASSLAEGIAERLGTTPARRYDYFMYVTGSPEMATSPEMTEALGAVRRYEMPQSIVATQKLVERFPREPDAHVLRLVALWIAALYPDSSEVATMLSELETLHRLDPRSPWVDLGHALVLPQDARKAALLGQILGRPDLTPAARGAVLALRSDVWAALRDTAAALADAREAIRLDPASDLSLSTLARRLSETGRYREASERVRQAVALNPTVVNYWLQLGNCMLKQGQWEAYVADLGEAAARSPHPDAILSAQCDGLSCVGRYREAAACARRALELEPAKWYYGLQLGLALMRSGDWKEAMPLLERACGEGYPINCPIRAAANAVLLRRDGRIEEAEAEVRRTLALVASRSTVRTPETKSSAYALACYDVLKADRDGALRILERFPAQGWIEPRLDQDPNFAALRSEPRFRRVASWMRAQPIDHVFATWGRSP